MVKEGNNGFDNSCTWILIFILLLFEYQKRNGEKKIMREKIEAKIDEIIEYILSKDVKDITLDEYRMLESRLGSIRIDEMYMNNSMFNSCSCATKSEMEDNKNE